MKEKSKQLQTFILSLMMLIMGAANAWADTQTIKAGTESSAVFTYSSLTEYTYGGTDYWAYGDNDAITLTLSNSFSFTMSSAATISSIKVIGVYDDNGDTKTATVTISDGVNSVNTGSQTWNGRKNTTASEFTISDCTSLATAANTSFTVTTTGKLGVNLLITYTTGGGGGHTVRYNVGTKYGSSTPMAEPKSNVTNVTSITSGMLDAPIDVAEGYIFEGWYTDDAFAYAATTGDIGDDVTLYANYTIDETTIDPAGGTNIKANAPFTITAPTGVTMTKAYYKWSSKDTYNKSDMVDSDGSAKEGVGTTTTGSFTGTSKEENTRKVSWVITDGKWYSVAQNATYDVHSYTVTYDDNGSTGGSVPTDSNSPYAKNATVTVLGNTGLLEKSGYTFDGWNTNETGTGTDRAVASTFNITGNTTLYAKWTAVASDPTITYVDNHSKGTVPSATTGTSLTSAILSATPTSIASGYSFKEWCTDAALTTPAEEGTSIDEATTLYANYTIDGSITSSPAAGSSVVAGDAITTTATSTAATKMRIAQAATDYNAATLKGNEGVNVIDGKVAHWSISASALGTQTLSVLLTDGTFYSDVLTNTFSVGVATPVISCSSNTVTITCATDGATIRYTDDGTEPTTSTGTVYEDPFAITATKTIKAIAIKNATNSAVASKACTYGTSITDLPVTIDFNASPFSTSTNFSGASGSTMSLTQDSHEVYFHGSNDSEFSIVSGSPNALRMNSNGATNHFIAIPMSNINGRIDIEIWAPYAQSSSFTIRAVLDTKNGTTVQSAAPSAIKTAALDVNDYKDGHFYFRMKDLTATSGVLYIGPASSSYKDFQKIMVTSPAHYLIPDKASVTMGDAAEPDTVTITNYSAYPVLVKTVPSYVTATFEPSTGVLVITPKAIGTDGAIELAVDTDGDGIATDTDLSIPVTVTGITNVTAPTSAVYDTSGGSYSPTLKELSVTATKSATGNTGTLAYQWYSNTVNSNTGGTVISGATDNTLSTDKIRTTDSEKAAFYYCVVSLPGDSCKSVASDVAYVLTSKSKRYFQMSNVAGNRQTSTNDEKITGQVIAGGNAYVQTSGDYRYITRPSTDVAHTYVASSSTYYFKVVLPQAIKSTDMVTVLINDLGGNRGLTISSTDGTKTVPINAGSGSGLNSYAASLSALAGETTIYVKGKYAGTSNYFTDLIFSEQADLSVTGPTPESRTVQSGETPAAFTVTATGGTGSYTYAWKQDTSENGDFNTAAEGTVVSDGGTSTFTPTSKSVDTNTTYYYKCIVTSGGSNRTTSAATLTVTTLTHGYMTIDGAEHEGLTFSFAGNICEYMLQQTPYETQNKGTKTAYTNFWTIPYDKVGDAFKSGTVPGIGSGTYLKMNGTKSMTFYVKGASSFTIAVGNNNISRKYSIEVDGVLQGEYSVGGESPKTSINSAGSKIVITSVDSEDKYFGRLTFYQKAPATITVLKNGEAVTEATQYMGDGATEYEVETNGDGALSLVKPAGATDVDNGYRTTYAEVTLNNGILSVTPRAATPTKPSTTPEVITIEHTGGTSYADASTTLNVTVKKHTLALAFSYEKASFKASTLTDTHVIPSGSLPTLTATLDGEVVDLATLDIRYKTDDRTIGYFGATDSPASSRSADGTSYAVKYGGGQGGARIYAYVDNQLNPKYSSAKASFDLVVEDGTSNAIPKGLSIAEQQVFKLANSSGVEVVKLTYGGYKYNPEGGWYNSTSRGSYFIDGYEYYTRHGMDALDEYGYQLRGMSDEAEAAPDGSKSGDKITVTKKKAKKDGESSVTFDVYKYSSQNVGAHTFWYKSDGSEKRPDGANYLPYQRIRPFTLPTRGGYLKFEPKQTGKLTVYVWQNGQMESKDKSNPDRVGSKPRLGYWFDQDGWVQKPTLAPITKQPITSESYASDVWAGGVRSKMTSIWTTDDDKPAINMLTYQYCDDAENPTSYSETIDAGHTDLNPYFWKTREQINTNLDEEKTIISEKMTPVPFHNGYMVPENSYLKYVINVVAGKTYYFYGMMTKIGYVGMNFVEDDNVTISDTGKKFYHETNTLHLKADDNMATVVANSAHGDRTTYLGTVYDEVTLPSNYKKNQWSTICLPFPLSESQVEEAFGKGTQLTIYNGARKKGTGVYSIRYLSHVDRNILAGQPYFIKPTGVDANGDELENVDGVIGSAVEGAPDTKTRITFNTVCIDANFSTTTTYGSDEDVNASGTDIDHQKGYKFVGAYNNETLPTYSYIVSKGELRRFTGSTTKIPTYYAYLKPNTSASQSGSYSLTVDFNEENVENAWVADSEDEPTDVISMEAIADAMNNGKVLSGKAYNMMGQEVDPTSAKGIVIIDGKKYMFK